MSRMAKIFWNEVLIVAFGYTAVILSYLHFGSFEKNIFVVGIIALAISSILNMFLFGLAVPCMLAAASALLYLEMVKGSSLAVKIIFLAVIIFAIILISFVEAHEGDFPLRKIPFKKRIPWRIFFSLLCESATLIFVLRNSTSWKISLIGAVIGIIAMAAIAFFPPGFGNTKFNLPNHDGIPG